MRVLDEVAAAIQNARGRVPQNVVSAFGLQEQFGRPLTPKQWAAIQHHLACLLPPLEFVQGQWFLPDSFATIWDLVDYVGHIRADWDQPVSRTEAAWREAQIFIGVRVCIADAGSLYLEDVVREARLMRDLGLV